MSFGLGFGFEFGTPGHPEAPSQNGMLGDK